MNQLNYFFWQLINLVLGILIATNLHSRDTYIGSSSCASCHSEQYMQWRQSHHYKAMQLASSSTVAGDFNNVSFKHFDMETKFFITDGKYYVNTQGEDGIYADFQIEYTFGFDPLQQYLVKFPNGRYQALTTAWDNRSKEKGGQRWFHLYPDERGVSGRALHWTGSYFNWNLRCAECHSTGVEKNYSLEENSYDTSWQEANVSCEACHGGGADHRIWALSGLQNSISNKGFLVDISSSGEWQFSGSDTAINKTNKSSGKQLDVCATCHSRRSILGSPVHGDKFLKSHRLSLLTSDLYYADGQIRDEVYVYGSYLQSKMYQAGVECSNCHNPHSGQVNDESNKLCTSCHKAEVFDRREHHHHQINSTGAACKNCHMPETTYMLIDPRRDHSFRIPDPQLSLEIDSPNACNQCHQDKKAKWAQSYIKKWYGARNEKSVFATIFYKATKGVVGGDKKLATLALDASLPSIIRATATELLQNYPGQVTIGTLNKLIYDEDPLVRLAALVLVELIPPDKRFELLSPLLEDSHATISFEVAKLIAALPLETLSLSQLKLGNKAMKIVIDYSLSNSDAPDTHGELGQIYSARRQYVDAEKAYLQALLIDPGFLLALINLADLYRAKGEDWRSKDVLNKALVIDPAFASAHYAMGLLLVRQKSYGQALSYLSRAAELMPNNIRFQYVYSVALAEQGQHSLAIDVLKKSLQFNPDNMQLLLVLASQLSSVGEQAHAEIIYKRLQNMKNTKYLQE